MNNPPDFEVLLSTMNRSDDSFLLAVFKEIEPRDFPVLVINQVKAGTHLSSNLPGVRVIDSNERGLALSRNLAIREAKGAVCLLADDDVIYEPNLKEKIRSAYRKHPDADIITFQMSDGAGNIYKECGKAYKHNRQTISNVCSVVISFKPDSLKERGVNFDRYFGLGGTFETADEYVFMRNALDAGLQCYFEPDVIVRHPHPSSGMDMGNDRIVFAKGALHYKYKGAMAYLWLMKYIRFLWVKNYIPFGKIIAKYRTGVKGISKFKELKHTETKT